MTRLILIPLLLAVAGCAHDQTRPEFARPPADKLVCPDEPNVPEAPVTDEKNADYLKALRSAGAACRSDVDWLRAWFKALRD